MIDIKKIREDFPILSREVYGRPLVYLDSAATAQNPERVIARVSWMYRHLNANIHRGVHYMSQECTALYEAARETVRAFVNGGSAEEIVFTSGATAAINLVAYGFGQRFICKGDNVVVSELEHHSNIVPWQLVCQQAGAEIRVLPFDKNGCLSEDKLEELLDERTRIVAVTQASNVFGTRPDLHKIIGAAHRRGIPVLVDGCQGIVHGGTDVAELDCDFYVFSGHKLYAPTGIGVLYGKREWLEKLPPLLGGGDMVNTVSFDGTTFAQVPLKFEAGTTNYIGAIGLAEAIDYLSGFDRTQMTAHENVMLERATKGIAAIDGMTIYGTGGDKSPILSFNAEGVHHYDLGMVLDKLGIAIRTGTHCAQPAMAACGVTGMCRASFAMYNTVEEADALVAGVERAVKMLRR